MAESSLGALADPNALHEPLSLQGADAPTVRRYLRDMFLIRVAEEHIGELVSTGEAKCPCHLGIGQEAVAVGVATALRPTDRVFGAHRSHSHYLSLGGSIGGLMAEVLGKVTGCSRGFGGSMHLRAPEHGLVGTVPIVGATIPIATGAALAAKLDGRGDVAVSYFGDGATEEGVFHESLNMSSIMDLPVLYVCENNLFSSHLHISLRQPADEIARYGRAHGVESCSVDGNDVVEVARVTGELVARMRETNRPVLLEAVTYRWRGHVGHREDLDVGVRRKEDLGVWKGRDPIRRLADAAVTAGLVTADEVAALRTDVEHEVADALEQARAAAYPDVSELLAAVYPSVPGAEV